MTIYQMLFFTWHTRCSRASCIPFQSSNASPLPLLHLIALPPSPHLGTTYFSGTLPLRKSFSILPFHLVCVSSNYTLPSILTFVFMPAPPLLASGLPWTPLCLHIPKSTTWQALKYSWTSTNPWLWESIIFIALSSSRLLNWTRTMKTDQPTWVQIPM